MKLLRTLGFVAITALAAMAFVGTSSAMAEEEKPTAFCEVDELECPEESVYPAGTTILAQLLNQTTNLHANLLNVKGATLLGPNLNLEVTCFESHIEGESMHALHHPAEIDILLWNFKHCYHKSGAACIVTVDKAFRILILKIEPNLGETKVHGVLFTVTCGLVFKCAFEMEEMPMHALGTGLEGQVAELHANHAALVNDPIVGEIGCPKQAFFDALYEITEPKPLYITL